jgi:hypothetical protein
MLKTYIDIKILSDFFHRRPEPVPIGSDHENEVWLNFWQFLKNSTELHLSGKLEINETESIFYTQLTSGRGDAPIFVDDRFTKPYKNIIPKSHSIFSLYFIDDDDTNSQEKYRKINGYFFGFYEDYYEEWQRLNISNEPKKLTISKFSETNAVVNWDNIIGKIYSLTDVIICDNYLLNDPSLWESNLFPLIKALSLHAIKQFNILIYSFEGERHELLYDLDRIFEQISKNIKDSNISCKLGIILAPKKNKFKPRRIFTNYLFLNSDDSFNYFNSQGKIITRETDITYNPLTNYENVVHLKSSLSTLHKKFEEIKNTDVNRNRYTRGNLSNRLFEFIKNVDR